MNYRQSFGFGSIRYEGKKLNGIYRVHKLVVINRCYQLINFRFHRSGRNGKSYRVYIGRRYLMGVT